MNIWLEAIRKKLRFNYKGVISTEDLFYLDMSSLNDLYMQLNRELSDISGDSLLDDNDE